MINWKESGKNWLWPYQNTMLACLEGERKTMQSSARISQGTGQHLNQAPPKYRSTALPLDLPVQYHELTAKNPQS